VTEKRNFDDGAGQRFVCETALHKSFLVHRKAGQAHLLNHELIRVEIMISGENAFQPESNQAVALNHRLLCVYPRHSSQNPTLAEWHACKT